MKKFKWVVASVLGGAIVVSGGIGLGQQQQDPASPQAKNATQADPRQEPPAPSVAARRASGLEMLLRAAKKQEELGNHERALELTGQLEEAARGWGAELRRKAAVQRAVRKGGADVGLADPKKNARLQKLFSDLLTGKKDDPIVMAAEWQALTEIRRRRYLANGKKLLDRDEQTKAIQNQLEKRLSITFPADTPFEDVVRFFRENTQDEKANMPKGIPIYIDPVALEKAGATLMRELKVTIDVDNAPLKDSLRLVLDQLGLVYIVKDGLLTITNDSP